MAQEPKRGCGFRRVGALYLVGGLVGRPCDRLPLELKSCPVCGAGFHPTRSMVTINPYGLFGNHEQCKDRKRPCLVCDPPDDIAYIMMVGKGFYTPQSFLQEAIEQGVSKKIPFIPKKLKLGKTPVYLAHKEATDGFAEPSAQGSMLNDEQARLIDAPKKEKRLGIFCAFIPQRVEMLVWKSELTDLKREQLEKRGITPIAIEDGDEDHA